MVTGAAGFIGSNLAERLTAVAPDSAFVLVDDLSVGFRENLRSLEGRKCISIEIADVCDREAMQVLMGDVDVVFHLAVSCLRTSLADPHRSHDINAGGTLSTCLAAHRVGVKRFIYISSSEIYGTALTAPMDEDHPCRPTTVYGASKLAGENYALAFLRTHGMPVTIVRPFNTYGPREPYAGARAEVIPRFILRCLRGEPPTIYGDGSQTRDFTFVDDTVEGIVRAAECDQLVGDVVNVAFGREVSISQIAEQVQKQVGGTATGLHYMDARPGDVDRHYADITKARRLLDWSPRVELESGLARTIEWFEARGIHKEFEGDAAAPNW
jgi:UDP-glucose 4-epimerase